VSAEIEKAILDYCLVHPTQGCLSVAQHLNLQGVTVSSGGVRGVWSRHKLLSKNAHDTGGMDALMEKSRRKPNLRNRVDPEVEKAVVDLALEDPSMGQKRASNELRERGVFISGAGVRSVWLRHDLERFEKRLKALEAHVAKTGAVVTEAQLRAMERAKEEKLAWGEIETEHVGYLGSQDTFYVGTLKGVGRVYQQTFIDTYSAVGFCKLYTSKHPINAADILNDRVIPFFDEHGLPLLRMLTDRGTEYCGKPDTHECTSSPYPVLTPGTGSSARNLS